MINRRSFLYSGIMSAISTAFLSSFMPATKRRDEIVGCAPSAESVTATKISVQSGNWSSGSTWSGGVAPSSSDSVAISMTHTVTIDTNITVAGVVVNPQGVLQFSPSTSAYLYTSENIDIRGILRARPNDATIVHYIKFTNIDESAFVGTNVSMSIVASDKGLWVLDNGSLDFKGTDKKGWTELSANASIGNTSITVKDATGWRIGDEIIIATMDKPLREDQDGFYLNWDDDTQEPIDLFLPRNERKTITGVAGNTISFSGGLLYNHNIFTKTITGALGSATRTFYPEVANLTRNVRISGTDSKHRTHVFIKNSVPCLIDNSEIWYSGPRTVQSEGYRPDIVLGRYAWHFHHCGDGSIGSVVNNCVVRDVGGRCFVPHASNGIKITNCVAWNCMEQAYWYDFNQPTHFLTFEDNLAIGVRNNGVGRGNTAYELGQGDGNIMRRCRAVYVSASELHSNSGSYSWGADNEGVWIFENNMAHSSLTGIQVWQNTGNNHTVINYTCFNCQEGISHGAYGNSYTYLNGFMFDAPTFVTATSGNAEGVVFDGYFCDANGNDFCGRIQDSPIPSGVFNTNKYRNSTFVGYTRAAIQLSSAQEPTNVEKQFKCVDMIRCSCSGTEIEVTDVLDTDAKPYANYPLKIGNRFRVQRLDNTAYQYAKTSSAPLVYSVISPFASVNYGTGGGLKGDYYNGKDFNAFAVTRIDTMVKFQQWSYNYGASPNQVHHLVVGDDTGYAYSVREKGFIQPQYNADYTFTMLAGGEVRLTLNGTIIIDNFGVGSDAATPQVSAPIPMITSNYYTIMIEHKHAAGVRSRGLEIIWNNPQMEAESNVPMQQLYLTNPNDVCN